MGLVNFRWWRVFVAGTASLVIASCEKPFEPIQSSDYVFSIYGLLEATAQAGQRQWVRVSPIRTTLATAPGPIDAVVTLEEVETGVRVVMTDSVVRYLPVNFADTAVYAHNFSTAMQLVPGRRYRLTATRSDGAQASATVLIPVVTNPTLVRLGTSGSTAVQGVRHLALVFGIDQIISACSTPYDYYWEYLPIVRYDEENGQPPTFGSWGSSRPSFVQPPPPCSRNRLSALIIASGEPWPWRIDGTAPDPGHPRAYSNVEGGLGFLAGVQGIVCPNNASSCQGAQLFDGSLPR